MEILFFFFFSKMSIHLIVLAPSSSSSYLDSADHVLRETDSWRRRRREVRTISGWPESIKKTSFNPALLNKFHILQIFCHILNEDPFLLLRVVEVKRKSQVRALERAPAPTFPLNIYAHIYGIMAPDT